MPAVELAPEAEFLIDFNVYQVPAIVGLDIPPAAAATMVGATEAQFVAYVAAVTARVHDTAASMLADPKIAEVIDQLEVPAEGTMMAVGDSITTYRLGYARLLAAMVEIRRPDDHIRFLNVGESGYTTTDCLENTYTQFLAEEPDSVFIKVGVNDSKHFGGADAKSLVSPSEYRANMAAMVQAFLAHTPARPVLLTPVPVIEDIANEDPGFQAMRMTWRNDDIFAAADAVQELADQHGLPSVDLVSAFGRSPDPALYLADGLHPNPAGHRLILTTMLRALSLR
jgi:acyl-CoA thioesterase-1